jgi:ribosomal protein S15
MLTARKNRGFTDKGVPAHLKAKTLEDVEIIDEWQVGKHDKGSIDVEIGLLSGKISRLEEQLQQTLEEDFIHIRLHLISGVHSRRRKLDYLRNTDTKRYYKALERLGMCA